MTLLLAAKEIKIIFSTPLGWVLLGALQFVLGSYFTVSFNQYFEIANYNRSIANGIGITQFICEGVFGLASMLVVFSVPLVAMNLISEERKRQTLTFLISAPVSITEIVLGKFIGVFTFFSMLVLGVVLMILSVNIWTDLDIGYLFANALGLWLLISVICAIGLFYSSCTDQPIVAGFYTFISVAMLSLLDKLPIESANQVGRHISMMQHYKNFSHGMIQSYDFMYFSLLTLLFLVLAVRKLTSIRLYG